MSLSRKNRSVLSSKNKEDDDEIVRGESIHFVKILKESGIQLLASQSKHPHRIINKDTQDAIKSLSKIFETDICHPEMARKFTQSFNVFMEEGDGSNLVKAMNPCQKVSSDLEPISESSDSLIKILLQVEDLQTDLLTWLLERLYTVATEEEDKENTTLTQNNQMKTSTLILSHLTYLNKIVNGEVLADKVIEILEMSSINLQQDLITALPEIVDQSNHTKLAMVLRNLVILKFELLRLCFKTQICEIM